MKSAIISSIGIASIKLNEWQEAWNEDGEKPKDQGSPLHDAFWTKLKLAAEQKVGKVEAERFFNSFQQIHNKLVNEELSLDAARSFLDSFSCSSTEE
ncbi:uncharacterized protein E5676_scaffold182G00590 [Cucumis melo var. makuwa]|uniref:Uncharacterized protein n=1 Tax=Cucumis melo var. makuwa TaxID=1194695 RepID=A0A5D3BAE6_CUCMM|nr:uncharacterized protein E6C27_scaffold212G001330 [Cucumis melo var. makuwa]TYJ96097.1 uncharacterized protein E5676_scaffold182G00590 [Cucumis melo var. makuwa]